MLTIWYAGWKALRNVTSHLLKGVPVVLVLGSHPRSPKNWIRGMACLLLKRVFLEPQNPQCRLWVVIDSVAHISICFPVWLFSWIYLMVAVSYRLLFSEYLFNCFLSAEFHLEDWDCMCCMRWSLGLYFQRQGVPNVSTMLRHTFLVRILGLLV